MIWMYMYYCMKISLMFVNNTQQPYRICNNIYCILTVSCRTDWQCVRLYVLNRMPVSVRLFVPHNIQLVRTLTVSARPPPPPTNTKQEKKSRARQKTLKINSTISENDLSIKMCHMQEWLAKGNLVSVLISKVENRPQVSFLKIVLVIWCISSILVFVTYLLVIFVALVAFSALTLLVGRQKRASSL